VRPNGLGALATFFIVAAVLALLFVPSSTVVRSAGSSAAVAHAEPFTVWATAGDASFPDGCGNLPVVQQFTSVVFGGTEPYSYAWSFGDGTPNSTLADPSHQYAEFGEYTVRLVATDLNTSRAFSNITVGEGPPPCPVLVGSGLWPVYLLEIVAPLALALAAIAYLVHRFRCRPPPSSSQPVR
jgi:hypothetical protein